METKFLQRHVCSILVDTQHNMLIIKRILLAVTILIVAAALWQHELISYGLGQTKGQLLILWQAKPIAYFLEDEDFPSDLKKKILIIQEIRQYAIDSLGLNDTKNYTTLYDQKGNDILWNVSACEPYALKAYEWRFPMLGSFGYKGYFDREKAKMERNRLDSLGYDTQMYSVGAWSTLGWFKDPILSNMLYRSEGQLADLIIHELTHATVFVKDNLQFNENLASFVGHLGAISYLRSKYGDASEPLQNYLQNESDNIRYRQHMMRGAASLDSLYKSMAQLPLQQKDSLKHWMIKQVIISLDTVSFSNKKRFDNYLTKEPPNNANFMSYLRYHSDRDLLEADYLNNFNGDIKAYLLYIKEKYGLED